MKLQLEYGNGVAVLPLAACEAASRADLSELRFLIALSTFSNGGVIPADEVRLKAGLDERQTEAALRFWQGAGVITCLDTESAAEPISAAAAADSIPAKHLQQEAAYTYTGEELEHLLNARDGSLRRLIGECQNLAGKLFNPMEVNRIVSLSDHLGLEDAHILMLFAYCKTLGKTSVHYVERTALNLYDEGIDTLEKLEEYIRRREEAASYESALRQIFGIGGRSLTSREKQFIKCWKEEWQMPVDVVRRAYEITVDKTDKLSMPYLNKILSNWHEAGIHTVEGVEEAVNAYRREKDEAKASGGSFNTDEFIELALKRSFAKP